MPRTRRRCSRRSPIRGSAPASPRATSAAAPAPGDRRAVGEHAARLRRRAADEHLTPRRRRAPPIRVRSSSRPSLPDRDRVNRAVIVAPLLASGTQIAVGAPAASGGGHVSIFDVDVTTGAFTCAATLTATEARFGRAMTLVDLDGNGTPDHLLVGAPPTHAYLYTLPLSTGQAPSAIGDGADGAGDFGAAVAAFDIDGNPGDEMFVGNPGRHRRRHHHAGQRHRLHRADDDAAAVDDDVPESARRARPGRGARLRLGHRRDDVLSRRMSSRPRRTAVSPTRGRAASRRAARCRSSARCRRSSPTSR